MAQNIMINAHPFEKIHIRIIDIQETISQKRATDKIQNLFPIFQKNS